MAEVRQQKRQSIVLALTDHDLGNEERIEIDATDSNEDLTTDVEESLSPNLIDITMQGIEHGNGPVVQIQKEQRVSISKRLMRQKNTAKAIEDRFKHRIQDRQTMIDSLFDEYKDLHENLHKLEVISRENAVDEAIRIAEKEHASNYTEIRKLDKKNKEVKDGRKKMIQQLVAEQKQINQNIHELEEVVTAVSNNTPNNHFTEVQPDSLLAELCHHPRQKTNHVDPVQNMEGGRTAPDWSHIMKKERDECLKGRVKKHTGHLHTDLKDNDGIKPTMTRRILPATIMRLL